jgi:hypothetical protein
MKQDSLSAKDLKAAVKTIIGSCNAMGVLVEGKPAVEINKEINKGIYDKIILSEKTDISPDKKAKLAEQLAEVQKSFAGELARMEAAKKEKEALAAAKKAGTTAPAGETKATLAEEKTVAPAKETKPTAKK